MDREKLGDEGVLQPSKKRNPHKHLLYRPTSSQLLMFIATVMKELYEGKALLLYLCGDGLGKSNAPYYPPNSNSESNSNTTESNNDSSNSGGDNTNNVDKPSATKEDVAAVTPNTTTQHYSSDGLSMHAGRPERSNRSMSLTSPRGVDPPVTGGASGGNGGLGLPSHLSDALYPEDLRPFTRRPLFLIIDSESSTSFKVCTVTVAPHFFYILF